MKDNSQALQMDTLMQHHINRKSEGVSQRSVRASATHVSFDFETTPNTPVSFSQPPQDKFVEFSPSDVSFLASVSRSNFDNTVQTDIEHSIKEG